MKINEYPEVMSLDDDDYLLVDGEASGTKRISGKNNMIKMIDYRLNNVTIERLSSSGIPYDIIISFEDIGIPSNSKILGVTMGSWGSIKPFIDSENISGITFNTFISENKKNIAIMSNKRIIISYLIVHVCYI